MIATLTPSGPARPLAPETFDYCVICGDRGLADLILNVAFFLPLGVFLARRLGVPGTAVAGLVLSGAIELLQLSIPGRISSLADVAGNGVGALLGALLHHAVGALRRGRRPGSTVGAGLAVLVGGLIYLGGWLLGPAPSVAAYWGQWTPYFGPATGYPGVILDASFDGLPFPSRRLPDPGAARNALLRDWTLEGTVVKGRPPERASFILSIYDDRMDEILYLGAAGEDLLLRERLRAQDWRLDRPELTARELLASASVGDTIRVVARRIGDRRCLEVDRARVCDLAYTPGRIWSLLLYPQGLTEGSYRLADAAFLMTLFFPLGLVAPSWRSAGVNGGVAGALVLAAVIGTRLVWGPALELAGAALGLAVGYGGRGPGSREGFATLAATGPSGPSSDPTSPGSA